MSKLNEKDIVNALAMYLKEQTPYKICYYTNYVLRPPRFFPTQPDIDLILCRVDNGVKVSPIQAAEIKYIRSNRDGHVTPSYYAGLDEALALLLFGFDKVELIHIVEEKSLTMVYLNYARLLAALVNSLKLPLGYRVYVTIPSDSPGIYKTIRTDTGNIYNLENLWVAAPQNPLLTVENDIGNIARKNRRLLADILRIKL